MPNTCVRTAGARLAATAPAPMNIVWKAKPAVCWLSSTVSPTKARNGSIAMLSDASRIHSMAAANHSAGELGMAMSAMLARMAPARKKGRRRPMNVHVRSEK